MFLSRAFFPAFCLKNCSFLMKLNKKKKNRKNEFSAKKWFKKFSLSPDFLPLFFFRWLFLCGLNWEIDRWIVVQTFVEIDGCFWRSIFDKLPCVLGIFEWLGMLGLHLESRDLLVILVRKAPTFRKFGCPRNSEDFNFFGRPLVIRKPH